MKILVTGGRGQLGRSVATRGAVLGHQVIAPDSTDLDICDADSVVRRLAADAPDLVINAAAYTAVDDAQANRERAFAVNRDGAGTLARSCAAHGIRLLHVSTDYVFDGMSRNPYSEDDRVAPLNVYGESKAQGERTVGDAGGTVVRTSWLFAASGLGFVQSIVRLARERTTLRVVADQCACPTWADDLADALFALGAREGLAASYHYCGDGPITRHAFAIAIVEEARRHGAIACKQIQATSAAEFPICATRPAYSVLNTTRISSCGIVPPSWKIGLARVVAHELGKN